MNTCAQQVLTPSVVHVLSHMDVMVHECMHGWMNELINWMDGWVDGCMDAWVHGYKIE